MPADALLPRRRLGRTGLMVPAIVQGGFPFAAVNHAAGWDPYSAEGREVVVATLDAALDAGIDLVDTGTMYGDGHSERLIGSVAARRRGEVRLATKAAWRGASADDVVDSLRRSLKRLQTDRVEIFQLHGDLFSPADVRFVLEEGPLAGLRQAREQGLCDWIGITGEEAAMLIPLVESGAFDMVQTAYNPIQQGAAGHLLVETARRDVGVLAMRPLTSGILPAQARALAPELGGDAAAWAAFCLRFALSDSRVAAANVGMRWPAEVAANVALARDFVPPFDLASFPRGIGALYAALDGAAPDGTAAGGVAPGGTAREGGGPGGAEREGAGP